MSKKTLSATAGKSSAIPAGYADICSGIVELLDAARHAAVRSVNALMTASYWEIAAGSSKPSNEASGVPATANS
ncbi:hypothetical protein ACQKFE_09485 [Stutzerimonas stutzeri]|uniref:hypothetical protein n=1 Tax=Stutzerimonas stutzeri TaxID=316 RepID=UPI003D026537